MVQNLAEVFFIRALKLQDYPAIKYKAQGRKSKYCDMSFLEFSNLVKAIFKGLMLHQDLKDKACAIYSQTCLNWVACDLASISAGAFTVPIYPTSSNYDIEFILSHCKPTVFFVQNLKLLSKITQLPALKDISLIVVLEDCDLSNIENCPPVILLSKLINENQNTTDDKMLDESIKAITPNDLATVIYTSGTTGDPKGVALTHKNILAVLKCFEDIIPLTKDDIYLSYLPLSHVFERVCGEFYWLYAGGVYAFAEGVDTVGKNLQEVEPSMLLVVPRVLEFIYNKVQSGINGSKPSLRKLIDWALNIGQENFKYTSQGKQSPLLLRLQHKIADKLVLSKLRNKISSKLRLIVSGGAAGSLAAIEFFNNIGITTIEGYGLTETTAPVTVNLPHFNKIGTVGLPLPGVQLKLSEDNEIIVKGDSIFNSYYNNVEATNSVFADDWFKTGDIGYIDHDGFLKITDRKKDIIVNSAGKNIAPQRIENELRKIPMVSMPIVFGDKQKFLAALITLNTEMLGLWQQENDIINTDNIYKSEKLYDYIKQQIKVVSSNLAEYEIVKRFYILDHELSVEDSELTATMKVKRNVIAQKYKHIIEALFNERIDLLKVRQSEPDLVSSSKI